LRYTTISFESNTSKQKPRSQGVVFNICADATPCSALAALNDDILNPQALTRAAHYET